MKTKLIAIATAAVAIIPLTGSPASAATAGGTIAFECVASLPSFPSPQAQGHCGTGSLGAGPAVPSSAEGLITGATDTNQSIVLAAAGQHNFNADFTYFEPCVAGEPPATGQANGTATITGLQGVVGTTPVNGGSLTVQFTWVRGGATAAVTITGATLNYGSGTIVGTTVVGAGAAAFAPVLTAANLCPAGGPIKALVTGSATVAAQS